MKIVTAAEMREIDRITSAQHGVPSIQLMESAGRAVAKYALAQFPAAREISVICGKGNNGGDGLCAARYLREKGKQVRVLLLAHPAALSEDASVMLKRLGMEPYVATTEEEIRDFGLERSDLIVDGILGTGFRPPIDPVFKAAIAAANATKAKVLAIDIPSGAEADAQASSSECMRADAIVTFTALKPAHVYQFARVPTVVRQIGSPAEIVKSTLGLNAITPADFTSVLAPRDPDSNKGDFGHVLVLGGSTGKAGAAAMAGMAALRAGAGLVSVAVPKSILPTVASFAPEMMTIPLQETPLGTFSVLNFENMRALSDGKRALVAGPGAGQDDETKQFIRAFVDRCEMPVVVDADGLNAFVGHVEQLTPIRHPLILTPHPGEMARLTGKKIPEVQADRVEIARTFAKEHGCYLVLKGKNTVVAEPGGEVWINTTGNPGMATGGTGDILSGILAGLVAQTPDHLLEAVIAGVYLHGLAGDLAAEAIGERGMIATDLLKTLPGAMRHATKA
jgi:NAD(P)H-hydrate epimerase